jgi:hypothetical protein
MTNVLTTSIVRINGESGLLYVRSGIIVAFFISKRVHEMSIPLVALLERFIQVIPPHTLKWVVGSATGEEWREISETTINRLKESLSPEGARKRKLTAFRLNDSGLDAPVYSFELVGKPMHEELPDSVTLVQMTFPLEVLDEDNLETFISDVREFAQLAQPTSGYCAPVLLSAEMCRGKAFQEIKAIAMRHWGYDVQMNNVTRLDIGKKTRGARWITFLGLELTEQLGGIEALKQRLPRPITVEKIETGVLIRAGRLPEVGDVNYRIETPLLRKVAKVLEPITLFDEIDLLSNFANFDEGTLRRWERRFLS